MNRIAAKTSMIPTRVYSWAHVALGEGKSMTKPSRRMAVFLGTGVTQATARTRIEEIPGHALFNERPDASFKEKP